MSQIKFVTEKDKMLAWITNVPGFKGDMFELNFPESIGPTDKARWFDVIKSTWGKKDDRNWSGHGWVEGEIEYTIDVHIYSDYVDLIIRLTNKSDEVWNETFAFNCFSNKYAISIRDHECKRHWVRTKGEFKRLIEIPRVFGPRPALQLYSIEGAPKGKNIPFVKAFESTPEDVTIEGWFAIRSRDDKHMVAIASKPALFTFQNREYSCIHSSPTFGALSPDETGIALTRLYFVNSSLDDWYKRMTKEFENLDIATL